MSADRELLELAAKAAGLPYTAGNYLAPGELTHMNGPWGMVETMTTMWNPLTDDGDALRLAVKLRLQIKPGKHLGDGCTVETQRDGVAGCTAFYDDKDEQMRQAIVRAAAEIGRSMA